MFNFFFKGLTSSRILSKLEQDQRLTLQIVAEECQRKLNLKYGTDKIKGKDLDVQTVKGEKKTMKNEKAKYLTHITGAKTNAHLKIIKITNYIMVILTTQE